MDRRSDRDRGEEAVQAVLEAYYESIGTPPPAPGIERLAFATVDAAHQALRAQWEDDLLSDEVVAALGKAIGEARWSADGGDSTARKAMESVLKVHRGDLDADAV